MTRSRVSLLLGILSFLLLFHWLRHSISKQNVSLYEQNISTRTLEGKIASTLTDHFDVMRFILGRSFRILASFSSMNLQNWFVQMICFYLFMDDGNIIQHFSNSHALKDEYYHCLTSDATIKVSHKCPVLVNKLR